MPEAFIVAAVRTPLGRRNGALAAHHPADLSALVIKDLLARAEADPAAVDDVVWGCLDPVGSQAHDIGRTAWLAAGLPEHVPGVTVDRQCGSSQQAVHFAAQAVMSGAQDLVVAGGVQAMSRVPMNSAVTLARGLGYADQYDGCEGWRARYGSQEVSQFRGAELLAARFDLDRDAMEAYALESNRRAVAALAEGRFAAETLAIDGLAQDETPRVGTSLEKMAGLPPIREGGQITAATASQISDGAAALLVASEDAVKRHGLRPRARIAAMGVRGDDPVLMLSAPIPATQATLRRAGLRLADIDYYEVNEAFAPVPMTWARALDADPERLNADGGAIALGHPLGASGARLMTTLLHRLEATGSRYGLQTMCEAGGQANVTILERL